MKARPPVVATLALALGLVAALAATAGAPAQSPAPGAPNPARGAAEWPIICSHCHTLRDPKEFSAKDWSLIVEQMRVRANIPGQEARDIAAFLESSRAQMMNQRMPGAMEVPPAAAVLAAPTSPAAGGGGTETVCGFSGGNPTHGAAIFAQTCIACHGPNGHGRIPGTPDFTKQGGVLSPPHSMLQAHIENGFSSPSSPISMPPRGGNPALTHQDIRDVHAYLHKRFGCG